jgi:hypothetical protein
MILRSFLTHVDTPVPHVSCNDGVCVKAALDALAGEKAGDKPKEK